jgi:hypothetical protein
MAKEDANQKDSGNLKTIAAPKDAGPKLETFTKVVPGRRGHEGEEVEFVTLNLVADRPGQIIGRKRSGRTGAIWIGKHDRNGNFTPTAFQMDCEVVNGKPKIPKWAHLPDEDEAKVIEARRLKAHFAEGNIRAVNPIDVPRLR